MVDGLGWTGLRERAVELMRRNLELFDPLFGSPSAVAPSFPTAFDCFASLL
jgi:hypothetical protein